MGLGGVRRTTALNRQGEPIRSGYFHQRQFCQSSSLFQGLGLNPTNAMTRTFSFTYNLLAGQITIDTILHGYMGCGVVMI